MARKVPLLEVQMVTEENPKAEPLIYRELMVTIAETPKDPRQGATIDEIRKSIPLIEALEEAKDQDFVILEDEWWRELRDKAKAHRFRMLHRALVDFLDAIENAESLKAIELVKDPDKKGKKAH